MKFTTTSTLFALACGAAVASALPPIESEDLSIRAPAPGAYRGKRKRDLEDLEERDVDLELDTRDAELDAFLDMIERSFSDEGFGGGDIDARDMSGEFEDVLERDFEAVEEMD
ncbi:hypothetical protein FA13DRAFT_1417454 [Coprinellus micaceus]|uniref:Uncharacterized protein n=1 Tax=Coprinellus micaceus TaxID=71717 RepID=A0A4Y7SNV2_COPMI|nr:hypothetical protein FA13DRAFT_1417454 [Coprinellus micaceus]